MIVKPAAPSLTIIISMERITNDFPVSICTTRAIRDRVNSSILRIIGITCLLEAQNEVALVNEVRTGTDNFFIFYSSFQDFLWFEVIEIKTKAITEMGITVSQAMDISLSYRDRGKVIRITVILVRTTTVSVYTAIEFPCKNSSPVRAVIKIRAIYSAIKKIENRDP